MSSSAAVLSLLTLGMAGWAVVSATAWPWKAALFPLVIGVPVFVLGAVELCLTVTRRTETSQPPPDRRRVLTIFGWIAALFLLVIAVGFLAAIPAFVLLYLRIQGRERWPLSVALAAAAWAVVYVLFVRLLHVPLAEGLVQGWLRALGLPG